VGSGNNLVGEGRVREEMLWVREIKLPGGMGMGTAMCSRTGL